MCLDRFLEDLEAEFEEILWRDNPDRIRAERLGLLHLQSRHVQAALDHSDRIAHNLSARIRALEQLGSELAERVEIYLHVGDRANAWDYALRLDRLHHELAGLGRQASSQELLRQTQEAKLRDLDAEIGALQRH